MTRRFPLVLAVLVLVAAACGAAPYSVTDTLGRTLMLEKVPERIVLAGRATLLLVDAVYMFPGAAGRVVGAGATDQGLGDFFPFLDPGALEKTRFAKNVGPEQVAAARPDLVILKSYMKSTLGNALEKLGIPVIYLDLETPEKFYADVQTLGALFQQPERAAFILRWYQSRVAAVSRAVASAPRPPVLLVQYSAKGGAVSFTVPPAGWIQTAMTETAGGVAVWTAAGPGDGWKTVGVEQLSAWKPRYLFVISYQGNAGEIAAELRTSGLLPGTVAGFPSDYHSWDQADSRWILGLEWLASTMHPDLFSGADLRSDVTSFYADLYGVDRAVTAREILPRLESALARR
jgi:iron complex transport system substrate-binding protein